MSKLTLKKPARLAPLAVRVDEKPVKTGEVMTIRIVGDHATRYNEAAALCKEAEELKAKMKPEMAPVAINHLFHHNCTHPWAAIASVALRDDDDNITRISFTSKYDEVPVIQAEVLFSKLRVQTKDGTPGPVADINDYVARTIKGKFDCSCFLDAEGRVDPNKYDKIMSALETVSEELGIRNPLTTEQVILPLPTFHSRRWQDFDCAANQKISEIIQNQITFVPCPNAVTGLMAGEETKK